MHYPTVYSTPSDRPKFDFLLAHNFLSEYKSEIDKAKVRYNLGISDTLSLNWGNINGTIEDLSDLMSLIQQVKSGFSTTLAPYDKRILANESSIALINTLLVSQSNAIASTGNTVDNKLAAFLEAISQLQTDVAQNATNIKLIDATDGSSNITELLTLISNNTTLISALNIDTASLKSLVSNLDNKILSTETKIGTLNTDLALAEVTIAANEAKLQTYSASITSLQTDVNSYSTRINNLETKTASLESGYSTNLSEINSLKTRVTSLETKLSAMLSSITTLSTTVSNLDSSVLQAVANVAVHETRISALEAKVGSISITGIQSNYEGKVLSGTTTSDPVSISILAVYSNNSTTDVTALSSASSSNTEVATYYNGKITLNNPGNAVVTFTYQSYTCSITVKVEAAAETIVQYIGYADDWTDLFGKAQGYKTVVGTWTLSNTPDVHTAEIYAFWIITTETLTSVRELGSYDLDEIKQGTHTEGDNTYNIYAVGPTGSSDLTITIQ